jgi:hypothetical protein
MEEQSPYTNGPYLVLSDGSTFDAAHGCVITYVTDAGQEQLEESCDFKFVEEDEIETVTLNDLMSAYEKLHNVKLREISDEKLDR